MALTFVYGNSGSGKSEYIYQKIADMAQSAPYQHSFVVVPEQATMSTQKQLVSHMKHHVILNVDVVSFDRLAYRIFDELGVQNTVMEETGKSLVLRRIVEQEKDSLTLLRSNLTKMGYIAELKSVISELMQYGVSPDALGDFLEDLPKESALFYKLSDILHIYQSFDSYLKEGYVTAERVLDVLIDVAEQSAILKEAVFVFDGYTGFTPVQRKLIKKLMQLSADIYVTVTLDAKEEFYGPANMQDLFYMSHKMVRLLVEDAKSCGIAVKAPICVGSGRLSEKNALHHLEQHLFRPKYTVYDEDCADQLTLYGCQSPKAELSKAAYHICQLVQTQGYHYRDFAIVSSQPDVYEVYANEIFPLYEIPFFLDRKQSIFYHPLIELLRAIMEIAQYNYSLESVFRLLRTGLCDFDTDEIDLLENYCIEKGIRGLKRWKKHFLKPQSRHGRVKTTEEVKQETLAKLNELRQRLVEQTEQVVLVLQNQTSTVTEKAKALYAFLMQLQIEAKLQTKKDEFEQQKEEQLSAAYRQIYKVVIDLLDKFVDLLGEETLSLEEFSDVLEAGFASAKIGEIPQGNDCVVLGDIERTRLDGVKVLFFLGVNDGLIPKKVGRQSLLSAHDRDVLEEKQLELSPGEREQMFLQRFYLYLNLTKPSDALYVSYARLNQAGESMRPSYLIGVLKKLFSKLEVTEIASDAFLFPIREKIGVKAYLTGLLLSDEMIQSIEEDTAASKEEAASASKEENLSASKEENPSASKEGNAQAFATWKALHHWYMANQKWETSIGGLFDAHFSSYSEESVGASFAKLLYGTVLVNSVTRLELYAKCAFAHFLEYGLKLSERKEFAFENVDMGTVFHAVLQKYCQRLEAQYSWESITPAQEEQLLKSAMQDAILELPNDSLLESARSAYVVEKMYHIMQRSIWALTEQIRRGDFRPSGYEVEFSKASQLSPELLMRTVGSVDRLDTFEKNQRIYVKVVDYKSGAQKLQLLSLYYGKQLQLVLYLNAAMEQLKKKHPDKEIVPAGIFYFHLDNPMVDVDKNLSEHATEEEVLAELLNQMKPNGLISGDPMVYEHMDHDLIANTKSLVVPVTLKKDRSVSAAATSVIREEDFYHLSRFVEESMLRSGRRMMDGDIAVEPYRRKNETGCSYCSFRSVCGFEGKIDGYHYRVEEIFENEDIWEKIRHGRHTD